MVDIVRELSPEAYKFFSQVHTYKKDFIEAKNPNPAVTHNPGQGSFSFRLGVRLVWHTS